jgi:predicted O-methyltransferase YrrM
MTPSDYDRMMSMVTGHWITQIVHAIAKYSVADHLALGPATAAEIAKVAGTHPSATFRLLRTCASLGLVTYDGESRFVTTSLLDTLRTDNPQSLRDTALVLAGSGQWLTWGHFAEAVKAEHPQAVAALGKEAFDYLAERPDESRAFIGATTRGLAPVTREVARLLDTRSTTIVADIGGASGSLLHAVLKANPKLHGIVFDRPNMVESAIVAAAENGLDQRITAIGGDFFEAIPAADLYLLRYILHDWDDAACIRILRNCRRALLPGGRVIAIEQVLGEIGEAGPAPLMDMNMMVTLGGRERSHAEYRRLLEAAELRPTRMIPTNTPMAIIEAVAA